MYTDRQLSEPFRSFRTAVEVSTATLRRGFNMPDDCNEAEESDCPSATAAAPQRDLAISGTAAGMQTEG